MSQQAKMMKQLQQMQTQYAKMQDDLKDVRVTGHAGGGVIAVEVDGHQTVVSVQIDDSALEEGAEVLADLVLVACNDALNQSRDAANAQMQQLQQSLGLPPGMF